MVALLRLFLPMSADWVERFWTKVDKADNGCWGWIAYRDPDGYGNFSIEGRTKRSHRVAYELLISSIPEGMQLDHLCRNRGCVNPDHLEPVTCRENILRGESFQARNARKTHCLHGHLFAEYGFSSGDTSRRCRLCHNQQSKRSMQRQRDKAKV